MAVKFFDIGHGRPRGGAAYLRDIGVRPRNLRDVRSVTDYRMVRRGQRGVKFEWYNNPGSTWQSWTQATKPSSVTALTPPIPVPPNAVGAMVLVEVVNTTAAISDVTVFFYNSASASSGASNAVASNGAPLAAVNNQACRSQCIVPLVNGQVYASVGQISGTAYNVNLYFCGFMKN